MKGARPPASLPERLHPLCEAGFWPDAPSPAQVLETHISWVFLAGDHAWKIKKPVDFGFLDFRDLAQREHYCRRELALNRRLAPALYRAVLPLTMEKGRLRLNGKGGIIEWCLKMRRFAQQDLLDARLAAGSFEPRWLDALAADLAAFHERQPPLREVNATASLAAHIAANLDAAEACARDIARAAGEANPPPRLRERTEAAWRAAQPHLERRQAQGRVRDGHGDLHLRNIALVDGRPTPFDCIEFDDGLRQIDVMNDAAFLVMDLLARDRADLAMRFLSRWLEASGDYDGLHPLRLFLAYRAGVRGKVACLSARAAEDARAAWQEAARYFSLAFGMLAPAQSAPRLFAIGGFSGAGKSHLALIGAGIEHAIVIRSDGTRKRIARAHPGLPLYGEAMNELTRRALFDAAATALEAGWPVILDATFLDRGWRDDARRLAQAHGIGLSLFWIDAPEARLRARVRERARRGDDISDADLAVLESQLRQCRKPAEPDIRFLPDSSRWPGGSH